MKEMMRIELKHPLRQLFNGLVRRHLHQDVQLPDLRAAAYVSNLPVDLTHADNLYVVRGARGRCLEDVGEMLIESNPLPAARSFDREREARNHSR